MRMCFFREQPVLSVFTIDGKPLDSVFSHKVLGLILQSDLRRNAHVDSIVPKAAKRLYILRILNLPSLLLRREALCSKSFSKFTSLANSRFLPLLPRQRRNANDSATSLRNSSNFTLPAVRTERFKRGFIPSMLFSK